MNSGTWQPNAQKFHSKAKNIKETVLKHLVVLLSFVIYKIDVQNDMVAAGRFPSFALAAIAIFFWFHNATCIDVSLQKHKKNLRTLGIGCTYNRK